MTTPQGGSPDDGPDARRNRAAEPDPDVTSFARPPQDPPFPGAGRGWSEEGVPPDAVPSPAATPAPAGAAGPVAPADPTVVGGWAPPAAPGQPGPPPDPGAAAPETRLGWSADPPPEPWPGGGAPGPAGWAAPQAPEQWSPGPPSGATPGWGTGQQPGWAPGPEQGWGTGQQPGWATGQQPAAAPGPQPGWATGQQPAQPGWPGQPAPGAPGWTGGHPGWGTGQQPGWGTGQNAWAPPPGGAPGHPGAPGGWGGANPPTQVGAPWGPPGGAHPGWAPQSPPPRNGRLVALIAVGVLLLAALGVGGYLLIRETSTAGPPVPADFRTITTSTLTYAVPPGWVDSPDAGSVLGAPLEGRADAPGYECDGSRYFRGVVASAFVPGERPVDAVATSFARETGSSFYRSADGTTPDVQVSEARPYDVGGVAGRLVETTSRTPTDDGCLATSGTVLLLALPTTGPDGAPGTAVLVVNGDTAGGPASAPPMADRATLDAVVASARLPSI